MIRKDTFRLKKNGETYRDCFCKDFTKIENYSQAVLDTTQTWDCHHRLETHYLKNGKWISRDKELTAEQLIEDGKYFDVPPEELIFLTRTEHNAIHDKGMNRKDQSKKILCVETGEIFESISDASRKTGVDFRLISAVCLGKRKTTGGYHWAYAPTEIED